MTSSLTRLASIYLGLTVLIACTSTTNQTTLSPKQEMTHDSGYETYIKEGEPFKHDTFTTIENKTVKLSKGKKLVILFATWCSDSQRVIKQLQQSTLVHDPALQIIAIGREENAQTLTKFKQDYDIDYSLIADPNRAIYSQYANKGVPRLILLDEQNKVVKTLIGEDPNTLQKVLW